jgi:YegS/Rv2252/BmrU family lipid kinase
MGLRFTLVRTEWPGHATELARQALAEGAELVVAAGGDGTANEVAQALVGQNVPLGIIPLGSGNDYIRALGVPNDLARAVEVLSRGGTRPVDVGRVADRFYLNSLGIGLDAQIAWDYQRMRFLKGELGYLWAALLETGRFHPFRAELMVGNKVQMVDLLMLSVMNGPYAGGGFRLAPGARADDGKLDLIMIGDYPRISRLPILFLVRPGGHLRLRRVRANLVAGIRIRTDLPVPVHMDGELLPRMDQLGIEVLAGALRVVA